MASERPPSERRWRNAIVLLLGVCLACIIIAEALVSVSPNAMEWAGVDIPFVFATIGTMAGIAGCLCAIIVVEMRKPRLH
jgi:hypothetical protein